MEKENMIPETEQAEVTGGAVVFGNVQMNPQPAAPHSNVYTVNDCIRYQIKSGDTLSGIGAKFGIPYTLLQQINDIPNVNKIWAGQYLWIPKALKK